MSRCARRDAERRLEPEHPGRRLVERLLLGLAARAVRGRWRWRRSCRRRARPVRRRRRRAVRSGGLTLNVGVVAGEQFVGEAEVVRRRLGGDGQAVGLGRAGRARRCRPSTGAGSGPGPGRARTSSMSRWTISSSAIDGQPGRPSRLQHSPSCITAPSVSRATSQCWASTMSRPSEYSNARRMSSGSCTPLPSSVKIRTPTAASSAKRGELRRRGARP